MKASDLFVKALEAEGVEYIFGLPGEETLDLLQALKDSRITLILTRHEQAAGFMAATYGRLTGKAGVCLATLGPGATNLVTAAAYAQLGAMPIVMITGQKPIKHSKQGQFQIINVVDMMRPLTKLTRQVTSGENIPANVREAFRVAQEERPGATHLEFPEDIAVEQTNAAVIPVSYTRRPIAEEKAIKQAVAMIEHARRPLLVIGAGANRKLTARMLRQFIDKTGIPFVSTQMGKGVVDERDPLYLGNAALSDNDFVHRAIGAADLIINVGHDVVEKPPFFMDRQDTQVIHVNFFSAQVDAVYCPQLEVVGDIANSLWQIKERILPQGRWEFVPFLRVKEQAEEYNRQGTDDARFPVHPRRLVADVRQAMPTHGILALDNGIYKLWFARNYPTYEPNTLLLDNALATMGAGLPSAIAARLVYPDCTVMAVCGDGGFMMNSQELETAVRLRLNLVILVLRDDGYGMIKWKQDNLGFDSFGLDFGNPDFVKYAESYGAHGHRVETAAALRPLLECCLQAPGIHLIECPIDYSENDQILNRDLKEKSRALP
jgi:acetolactate synthase-1/2/3 large subunit